MNTILLFVEKEESKKALKFVRFKAFYSRSDKSYLNLSIYICCLQGILYLLAQLLQFLRERYQEVQAIRQG